LELFVIPAPAFAGTGCSGNPVPRRTHGVLDPCSGLHRGNSGRVPEPNGFILSLSSLLPVKTGAGMTNRVFLLFLLTLTLTLEALAKV